MRSSLSASLFACVFAFGLGACNSGEDTPEAVPDDAEAAGEADTAPDDGADLSDADGVNGTEATTDPEESTPDGSADERFTSDYITFNLDNCRVLSTQEEGEGATFRCAGYEGIPLFVQAGDGRFDVDAGVENDLFDTIGAFNEIAPRMEIRMDRGEPFAVIFRYRDVSMESNNRTVLAVEKIGRRRSPGCRVGQIGGGFAAANVRAREIADRQAADFNCANEPQFIGDAR